MDAYLTRSVLGAILATLLLLTALLGFSELLSQLGRLSATYPLSQALWFALLKMPAYAYDAFPMALLIGVLAGLGQLAAQGELTIVRVSGWSSQRLFWALAKGLLLLWLVMLWVGEGLAPWAEKQAMQLRLSSGAQHLSLAGTSGFWMKEGHRFISAKTVIKEDLLANVDVFQLDETGKLLQLIQADQAQYDGHQWQLQRVRVQWFHEAWQETAYPFVGLVLAAEQYSQLAIHMPFEPQALALMAQDKKNWSLWELQQQMTLLAANGMQTHTLALAFWRKLAHPVSLLAMLALSIPLLLSAGRASSMGGRVLLGVVIGLVFFLLNRVVGDMSALASLPPAMSAFALPVLILVGSLLWLKRVG
jgi:lipopolysaccharide export system permease protein